MPSATLLSNKIVLTSYFVMTLTWFGIEATAELRINFDTKPKFLEHTFKFQTKSSFSTATAQSLGHQKEKRITRRGGVQRSHTQAAAAAARH